MRGGPGRGACGQLACVVVIEQEDRRVELVDCHGRCHACGPRRPRRRWHRRTGSGRFLTADPAACVSGDARRRFETREIPHKHPWNDVPRWSPDGRLLAYTGAKEADNIRPESLAGAASVMVYDMEANTEEAWGTDTVSLYRPVWMNAGTVIAIGVIPGEKRLSSDIFIVTPARTRLPSPCRPRASMSRAASQCPGKPVARSNDGATAGVRASFKRGSTDVEPPGRGLEPRVAAAGSGWRSSLSGQGASIYASSRTPSAWFRWRSRRSTTTGTPPGRPTARSWRMCPTATARPSYSSPRSRPEIPAR